MVGGRVMRGVALLLWLAAVILGVAVLIRRVRARERSYGFLLALAGIIIATVELLTERTDLVAILFVPVAIGAGLLIDSRRRRS